MVSFGYLISCISPNLQIALALAPTLIIPVMIFGGFFLKGSSVPDWLNWMQYISWFKYSNELLVINQWEGVEFSDCPPNITANCFQDGEQVLQFYGFDEENWAFNFGMLVALAFGFRILGFFALLAKTFRKSK